MFFLFKQKTAYEMRISDWSSDVCSSDLLEVTPSGPASAALAVERLALAFDDDTRSRVLAKGSELRATAEINSSGVGLITGQWEVATGATSHWPVIRDRKSTRLNSSH